MSGEERAKERGCRGSECVKPSVGNAAVVTSTRVLLGQGKPDGEPGDATSVGGRLFAGTGLVAYQKHGARQGPRAQQDRHLAPWVQQQNFSRLTGRGDLGWVLRRVGGEGATSKRAEDKADTRRRLQEGRRDRIMDRHRQIDMTYLGTTSHVGSQVDVAISNFFTGGIELPAISRFVRIVLLRAQPRRLGVRRGEVSKQSDKHAAQAIVVCAIRLPRLW